MKIYQTLEKSNTFDGPKYAPVTVKGYPVEHPYAILFVYKRGDGLWSVTEAKTGMQITVSETRKGAISKLINGPHAKIDAAGWKKAIESALISLAQAGYINGPLN